jgi:hypothetical protein
MSFGLYSIGFAILIGGLIYGAHLNAHAGPLDCSGCGRALRRWDSDGRQERPAERSCGISPFSECHSPLNLNSPGTHASKI